MTKLSLIRHAPSIPAGHLFGRTDAEADVSDRNRLAQLRDFIGAADAIVRSPARRCEQTLAALWPEIGARPPVVVDESLWEQDFGELDGQAYTALPNLGPRSPEFLADFEWPGGESFQDVVQRVTPTLDRLTRDHPAAHIAIVTHAGPIRAALAHAAKAPAHTALTYQLTPLSLVQLTAYDQGWSIDHLTNRR